MNRVSKDIPETPVNSSKQTILRQGKAFKIWVEGGGNITKAEALRQAGYGKSTINKPSRVFKPILIEPILKDANINLAGALNILSNQTSAKKLERITFPFQVTDSEIETLFKEEGIKVVSIINNKKDKVVFYWADNNTTQLRAIDIIMKLYGLYPPKRKEQKRFISTFSLSELRKQKENR